ncbi:hypothetical protein [Streptomyces botrytidirepellens]|uniref:hypothetical protein n=1 Tax=Streptomyces botrytidirepellens TaxID=2486417 RepID=UPI001FEC25B4|nr:hypothetical protein [Streptomyces botrytidirepellens]
MQVAYLAEEFADLSALGEDLGVGGFKGVLGVQGAFAPGRFAVGDLAEVAADVRQGRAVPQQPGGQRVPGLVGDVVTAEVKRLFAVEGVAPRM